MAANDTIGRYIRQTVLSEVGLNGQDRLSRTRLLVVGAGGLGCAALPYLAGAGVGSIMIVDPDRVSLENLHRQTLYSMSDLGAGKAETAARALSRLNPESRICTVAESLTPSNVVSLLAGADIALDCADSIAATYILSDACHELGIPLVSASAIGLSGYAGGFCGGAPSVRAVFPDPPSQPATCAEAGVLGPVPGTLGCIQAQMALSVLLDMQPSPLGLLVALEARTLRFSSFRFDGATEPGERRYPFVSRDAIDQRDLVIDLRGEDEAPVPATPSAIRACVTELGIGGPLPERNQRVVLCCRSGLRSWQAANRLRSVWSGEIVLAALGGS